MIAFASRNDVNVLGGAFFFSFLRIRATAKITRAQNKNVGFDLFKPGTFGEAVQTVRDFEVLTFKSSDFTTGTTIFSKIIFSGSRISF